MAVKQLTIKDSYEIENCMSRFCEFYSDSYYVIKKEFINKSINVKKSTAGYIAEDDKKVEFLRQMFRTSEEDAKTFTQHEFDIVGVLDAVISHCPNKSGVVAIVKKGYPDIRKVRYIQQYLTEVFLACGANRLVESDNYSQSILFFKDKELVGILAGIKNGLKVCRNDKAKLKELIEKMQAVLIKEVKVEEKKVEFGLKDLIKASGNIHVINIQNPFVQKEVKVEENKTEEKPKIINMEKEIINASLKKILELANSIRLREAREKMLCIREVK